MKLHLDSTRASAARKLLTAFLAVQTVALNFSPAWAAPAADALPKFQEGYADRQISREGGVLNITAGGDIKYDSFNIGSAAEVHFVGGETTVNKIYDANPSQIFGLLTADGKIYLLNANGILFGSTARVNVGGLVASTFMDVGDDPEGNLVFQGDPGNGDITVESGASINAGAFAYLVGRNVNLGGSVNAGDVQVAAFGGGAEDIELTTANGGKILIKLAGATNAAGGSISITNSFTNASYTVVYTNENAEVVTDTVAVSNITLYTVSDISQSGDDSAWTASAPVTMTSAGGSITIANAANQFMDSVAARADNGAITLKAADALTLGDVSSGGLLTVGAGSIAQAEGKAITAKGADFTAAGGDISIGNAANKFTDPVQAKADNGAITIMAADALNLGEVTAGKDVSVTAGGNLVLGGIVSVENGSLTAVSTAGSFTSAHDLAAGQSITIESGAGNLALGNMTAGNDVSVTAKGGNLALNGVVTVLNGSLTAVSTAGTFTSA